MWIVREEKGDINRNQVPRKTRVVTLIALLNLRITKKDTFQRLMVEFRHLRTNISNKTGTPKYPRLNREHRFIWKKGVLRSVPIQDGEGHLVNKKTRSGNNIGPEILGHMHLK